MTRPEITGVRDLGFSGWIRKKLPDSKTGFLVSDLDFVLENYKTKKIMLVEIKTRNAQIRQWQRILFKNINKWISEGMDEGWSYLGFHLIRFENTSFDDGKVFFDNKQVTEDELIEILSF